MVNRVKRKSPPKCSRDRRNLIYGPGRGRNTRRSCWPRKSALEFPRRAATNIRQVHAQLSRYSLSREICRARGTLPLSPRCLEPVFRGESECPTNSSSSSFPSCDGIPAPCSVARRLAMGWCRRPCSRSSTGPWRWASTCRPASRSIGPVRTCGPGAPRVRRATATGRTIASSRSRPPPVSRCC